MTCSKQWVDPAPAPPVMFALKRVCFKPDHDGYITGTDLHTQEKPIVAFNVWGNCPQCGDLTSDVFPLNAFVADTGEKRTKSERRKESTVDDKNIAVMHCNCNVHHIAKDTGETSTAFGCGATWLVGATGIKPRGKVSAGDVKLFPVDDTAVAAKCWNAAEAVSASLNASLGTVQTKGTAWATGISTLLAVVGIGGLLTGRDAPVAANTVKLTVSQSGQVTTHCGVLPTGQPSPTAGATAGQIAIVLAPTPSTAPSPTQTYPMASVLDVSPVSSC